MTTQIIVMNMGHGSFAKFQPCAILHTASLLMFHYYKDDIALAIGRTPKLGVFFQILFGLTTLFYMSWSIDAIWEICYVLDINCLTINPPKEKINQSNLKELKKQK